MDVAAEPQRRTFPCCSCFCYRTPEALPCICYLHPCSSQKCLHHISASSKWSGIRKINIPAKTHHSKPLTVSRTEYAKMLRRTLCCWSWQLRSLHSTAQRTSPGHLPPYTQTFRSPSHYSSAPCSHAPICCLMIILRLIFEVWSQEV